MMAKPEKIQPRKFYDSGHRICEDRYDSYPRCTHIEVEAVVLYSC